MHLRTHLTAIGLAGLILPAVLGCSAAGSPRSAYVLQPGEGIEVERGFGGELKATPRTSSGYLLTMTEKPSGFRTPIIRNPRDMSFYVLRGELSVYFDGEVHELVPGAFAHVPRGVAMAFSSTGPEGAAWIHVITPGDGQVTFWEAQRDIGESTPDRDARMEKMIESAADFGIEYVAPSPFGRRR